MLTLQAPAKINLTLEVLGKRADGYHEIKSVVQTISLFDTLSLEESEHVSFECDLPEWSADKSLLHKVVGILGSQKGARITIQKRIPMMAGFGGDSSDAAALLKGLDELWNLKLSANKFEEVAREIGSDVSFFLSGGTALMEGRGEKLTRLPSPPGMWLVLVVPDVPRAPGKTARMYAALRPAQFTDGAITKKAVVALKRNDFTEELLFNTFENIAFNAPDTRVYVEHLLKMGAPHVHLAGSGPALFILFPEKPAAEDLYTRCRDQGMHAYPAQTNIV